MYGLIILGGGPAGYNAAERAATGGIETLVIEERALGGVCERGLHTDKDASLLREDI